MSTSTNSFDALESLIYEESLCIEAVDVHKELGLLLIVLNTKTVLRQPLSKYSTLAGASEAQLQNHRFIGNGTGINWPELDEDLSLKGFLRDELRNIVQGKTQRAA